MNWKYQPVEVRGGRLPVAPHVVKYDDAFYMSGNDAPFYKASDILGPYEVLGPWKNERGEPWTGAVNGKTWRGAFDVDIFVDDDNKPCLYFPGRPTEGIYVAPLDAKDLSRFAARPKHLFGFKTEHVWERWGENNEYLNTAWIEGPWVLKRNGVYYLEYSMSLFGPEPARTVRLFAEESAAAQDHEPRRLSARERGALALVLQSTLLPSQER